MATKGRLVAGSHNRNEFVLINAEDIGRVTSVKELSGQNCKICGDEIEVCEDNGDPFVACNECAFPVCRPCYEYERREGNQACPQCRTRYKRLKGSPRVEGDDDEDGIDDLENELKYASKFRDPNDPHQIAEAMLAGRLNAGRAPSSASGFTTPAELDLATEIPLLTYGHEDAGISPDKHALVPSFMSRANKVHPAPYSDSMSLPPRPMDPKKDLALYGYGSVAWKDRMEDWRKRQNEKLQMIKHQGENGGYDGGEPDDPDLPKYVVLVASHLLNYIFFLAIVCLARFLLYYKCLVRGGVTQFIAATIILPPSPSLSIAGLWFRLKYQGKRREPITK